MLLPFLDLASIITLHFDNFLSFGPYDPWELSRFLSVDLVMISPIKS